MSGADADKNAAFAGELSAHDACDRLKALEGTWLGNASGGGGAEGEPVEGEDAAPGGDEELMAEAGGGAAGACGAAGFA